jgi:ABC-type nickel/cobalt efflux system permease component RcnA
MQSPYENIFLIVFGLLVIALRKNAARRYLKWHKYKGDPKKERIFMYSAVVGGIICIIFGALSLVGLI